MREFNKNDDFDTFADYEDDYDNYEDEYDYGYSYEDENENFDEKREDVSAVYKKIGDILKKMTPVDFEEIYYLGEIEKDELSSSSIFYFIDNRDGKVHKSYDIPAEFGVSESDYEFNLATLTDYLFEIYDGFTDIDEDAWCQVTYKLSNNDKFDIQVNYKDFDEDYSQIKREIIWAYETFEYIPEDIKHLEMLEEEYDLNTGENKKV